MAEFAESLTLRQARDQFFAANAATFGPDGGYDAKWVRIEMGPFPIYLPNMEGRRKSVVLHDLHHIVTGYSTNLTGETEIGAWEVGTGCRGYWHAWVLNMWAFALGLFIAPRKAFRAFVRGRRTGTLYDHGYSGSLLDETVGHMRARLRLDAPVRLATTSDIAAFVFWAAASGLVSAFSPLPLLIIAIIVAWLLIR